MLEKLNTLAISVTENNLNNIGDDPKEKAIWIIVLIAIIAVCVIVSRYVPNFDESLSAKKREKQQKKIEKARDEELERLHKIKKKNKRK